jgi:hypothetical protein
MTQAENAVSEFATGLGFLVWYNLKNALVTPTGLRALLARENETDIEVPDIVPRDGIIRATREWSKGRRSGSKYKAEVVHEDDFELTIGILKHHHIHEKEVGWAQIEVLTFDKTNGSWVTLPSSPLVAEFVSLAQRRCTYLDHSFVRPKILQAKLDSFCSFKLRDRGGVYFVLEQFIDEVEKLKRIINQIGYSTLRTLRVTDIPEDKATITTETREHLDSSLAGLRERMTLWRTRTRKVRSDALGNTLEEFKGLRSQAELYADALQIQLDDFLEEIDDASSIVKNLLGIESPVEVVEEVPVSEDPPALAL